MSSNSRLVELAELIIANAKKIDTHIQDHNQLQPSFSIAAPTKVVQDGAPEIEAARVAALEATVELQDLLQGPEGILHAPVCFLMISHAYVFPSRPQWADDGTM